MGLLLSLLLKPFIALVVLTGPFALAYFIWKWLPDSRIKRFLFKSYGEDNGPWVREQRERERREARQRVRLLTSESDRPDSTPGE